MKQKFKNILKLFALGSVFALTSCEKDLYDDAIYQNNKITMKRVSLKNDSLRMNFNLMDAVNKVRQRNQGTINALNRMVYDSINNFYFDDEKGVLIEKDGKESYTFPIKRITGTETKLENIIFDENETGTYETYFSKYNFTEKQMDSMTDLEIKTETPIITNESFSRVQVCLVRKDLVCYPSHQGDLVGAGVGTTICTWVTTILGCEGSGGGGGGNPNNNGNDGGGATNNGGPKDITTTPSGGGGGNGPNTPCGKLGGKTSNNNAYMNKFNALNKPANFNLPYETGFIEKNYLGNKQYVNGTSTGANGGNTLNIPNDAIGYTHVHNNKPNVDPDGNAFDGGVKMLSPTDLIKLVQDCTVAATAAGETPLDAYGIMISNEGIFALTILDNNINYNQDVRPFINKLSKNYKEKAEKIIADTNLNSEDRSEKIQEMMLKLLEEAGLKDKIGLFEGVMELEPRGNKLKWTRKTLSPAKKVIANPC